MYLFQEDYKTCFRIQHARGSFKIMRVHRDSLLACNSWLYASVRLNFICFVIKLNDKMTVETMSFIAIALYCSMTYVLGLQSTPVNCPKNALAGN